MFIGEYTHTLDEKKRLSVPAKFRAALGTKAILTNGLNRCLALYPEQEWKRFVEEKLSALSLGSPDDRKFSRFMLSGAFEVEIDKAGRILVPDNLKVFAGLEEKVILTGVFDRVEIWNDVAWEAYKAEMALDADNTAERLGEKGVF